MYVFNSGLSLSITPILKVHKSFTDASDYFIASLLLYKDRALILSNALPLPVT